MQTSSEPKVSSLLRAYRFSARYCKEFMQETSLHGLKFVADASLTLWERSYFLIAFIMATTTVITLVANIYAKWDETPVIIGMSPQATSISSIPFPALTVCNMNKAVKSKVSHYKEGAFEYAILQYLCNIDSGFKSETSFYGYQINETKTPTTIPEFIIKNSQPCSEMLISCSFGSKTFNCMDIFREVMTDEGVCCIFNTVAPELAYKMNPTYMQNLAGGDDAVPVQWDPENGFPETLPPSYYPRSATGTGISLGLSLILNANATEYFCSSTNGPGFKISLTSPADVPQMREAGLPLAIGYETRFRIDAKLSEASSKIRSIGRYVRQCLFNNEEKLKYYKIYTRRNCETECLADFLYRTCECIPYSLPLIYSNSSVCRAKDLQCTKPASIKYNDIEDDKCRERCLPACFELSFFPDAFPSPLAVKNFVINNPILRNLSKDFLSQNIAIVHIYYRESVFFGTLKNVYIGFTEFLSNVGGVLGLFTGFSFISLAEVFYFAMMKPFFDKRRKNVPKESQIVVAENVTNYNNWLDNEIWKPRKIIVAHK